MQRYTGRAALITGAARGIGYGVASRLAQEGASIAIIDLDEAAAAEAASRLPLQAGAKAVGVGADVQQAEEVETAVTRAVEELGDLSILVNNAGVTRDNLLFKMTEQDWDLVMGVHLKGHFLVSRVVQEHFVQKRYGRIVNISSTSALGNRGQANYSAAKAGVQGFTRTLALELGPFGVTVNAVAPGFIASEMTDQTAARLGIGVGEFRKAAAEANPVRRIGDPDDIAAAIAFLASEEAGYITGQTLYIDGGSTI